MNFEEGNPERPLVMGSMSNGADQPPLDPFHEAGGNNGGESNGSDVERTMTRSDNVQTVADSKRKKIIGFQADRVILHHPVTHEPLEDTNYSILSPDGKVFSGATDAQGRTQALPLEYAPESLRILLNLELRHSRMEGSN